MLSMNVMILSLSSTLSQAKGAVYAYEVVYQGAWAQHDEDDDGDDDDFADKAVWGVHHQRGRVHQEASGKDIYGDGQHLSANSSLEGRLIIANDRISIEEYVDACVDLMS